LDFDSDLQSKTQGKFPNHTLQLAIPFVHFRGFSSFANPFCSKRFVILLQVLSVFLLQGGLKGDSSPLTMFLTAPDLILFGFLGLCLHCAFFYSICSMLQNCLFLCKRV
jgi:hypothetical protein